MPNPFPETIGMPYHGLAVGGSKTFKAGTPYEHTVSMYPSNACRVARNPHAPGVNRTPVQQSDDNLRGREWRDYVLLVGTAKRVNGGSAIGENAWLYCDANGVPWVLSLRTELVDTTPDPTATKLRLAVWREKLFGRFGRTSPAPERLTYLDWVPDLPPGSTAYQPHNVVLGMVADAEYCIVPNPAGNSVIVNCFHAGGQLPSGPYPATDVLNANASHISLAQVFEITASGAGDLGTGTGLAASIAIRKTYAQISPGENIQHDYAEPFLVWGTNFSGSHDPYATHGQPSQQDIDDRRQVQTERTETPYTSGATTRRRYSYLAQYTAVLFETHEGTITRTQDDQDYSINEAHRVWGSETTGKTWEASEVGGGTWQELPGLQTQSGTIYREVITSGGHDVGTTHTLYGASYSTAIVFSGLRDVTVNGFQRGHGTQLVLVSTDDTTQPGELTIDGVSYSLTLDYEELLYWHEVRLLSGSVAALTYGYMLPDETNARRWQYLHAAGDGSTALIYSAVDDYLKTGFAPLAKFNSTWQPVTGQAHIATTAETIDCFF